MILTQTSTTHAKPQTNKTWTLGLSTLCAALLTTSAWAQMTPVGTWRSIDDDSKEAKSEVIITQNDGVLTGRVSKLLRKDAKQDAVCSECKDERKDKPIIGLDIIRGAKKTEGKDVWEGGTIIDPENGKSYKLKLTPLDSGKQLEVRGYIAFFSRGQVWVRVQ
jgi:uncharacterized protein (DUF2147 family)